MATTATFPAGPKWGPVTFANADATTLKAAYTAGANGGRVNAINATSTDTADHDVQVWLNNGTGDQLVATLKVPLGAGNTSGVAQANLLALLGSLLDGAGYLLLPAAGVIKFSMAVAVTAGKSIQITVVGADF